MGVHHGHGHGGAHSEHSALLPGSKADGKHADLVRARRKLLLATGFCLLFMCAEVVGGYIAEPGWTTNAAGYKFHNWYGFGAVDTDAAVTLAKNYTLGSLGSFTTTNETSSGNLTSLTKQRTS